MYQWIVDNGMTPYLLVDAENEDSILPPEHIREGKIVLNIAPTAVQSLKLGDDEITFNARFSGKSMSIYVPLQAVLAVYARENGQGMMFTDEDEDLQAGPDGEDPDPDKPKPNLRVVK